MLEHCDFTTQHSVNGDDGKLRPDMVVRLPGGKTIVVDVKTPSRAVHPWSASPAGVADRHVDQQTLRTGGCSLISDRRLSHWA